MAGGTHEKDARQNALRAGMNDLIAKPIQMPVLLKTLAGLPEKQ